jgi:hypothetical protein
MRESWSISRFCSWLFIGVGVVIVLAVYLDLYRKNQALNAYSISPIAKTVDNEQNAIDRVAVVSDIRIDKNGMSPNVENGAAFDKSTEKVGKHTTVVIPEAAILERGGTEGVIEMYMTKELGFGGHPPKEERVSIREERKAMGCCCGSDGDKLVFMTYGEWFTKEGGAHLMVHFVVPENLRVETRSDLSGPNKVVPKEVKGWHNLPFEPDPRRID